MELGSDGLMAKTLWLLDGKVALILLVHLCEGWAEGLKEASNTALGSLGASDSGPRWNPGLGTTWCLCSSMKGWMMGSVGGETGTLQGNSMSQGCLFGLHPAA